MIELRVEDYCHDCPDFEPDCCKVYANGKIERVMVRCAYANRCRRITERLEKAVEDKYAQKAVNDSVAPVKTAELCDRCRYDMSNDLCCGRNDCITCEMRDKPESPTYKNGMRGCYCLSINYGDACKYYTPIKEAKNEQT